MGLLPVPNRLSIEALLAWVSRFCSPHCLRFEASTLLTWVPSKRVGLFWDLQLEGLRLLCCHQLEFSWGAWFTWGGLPWLFLNSLKRAACCKLIGSWRLTISAISSSVGASPFPIFCISSGDSWALINRLNKEERSPSDGRLKFLKRSWSSSSVRFDSLGRLTLWCWEPKVLSCPMAP